MRKSGPRSNSSVSAKAKFRPKAVPENAAKTRKPSTHSNGVNKASASAGGGTSTSTTNTTTTTTAAARTKKRSPDSKTSTKKSRKTPSSVIAVDLPPTSVSPGGGGINLLTPVPTSTADSTSSRGGRLEGIQIEEPSPSSSGRCNRRGGSGCPKANRVHTLVHQIGKVSYL